MPAAELPPNHDEASRTAGAPLLSVIVVARNVENYIQQALDSILSQLSLDTELVYVDDASTDSTFQQAQALRLKHPEQSIQLIQNATNLGLGAGRNIGLAASRGEYVIFMDGDDWLAEGALQQLKDIARKHAPELAVYNHARFYADGGVRVNRMLQAAPEGWCKREDRNERVIRNLNVAWNKLYQRRFLNQHQLQFGTGFYEDIDWNFKAILLAERLYIVPRVLVYYRQRPGSILRSVDLRHFDVFAQWSKVLDFLAEHPALRKAHGAAIEQYARNQMGAVLRAEDRVPESHKEAFFAQMAVIWNRFAKEFENHPRQRKIDRFIRRNQYKGFKAFLAFVEAKRSVRRLSQKHIERRFARARQSARLRVYREVFLKLPINPRRVVFEAYWGKKMDCNPYAIFTELSKRGGYECYWVLRPEAEGRSDFPYQRIEPGTLKYYWATATAKYLVSNVNFPTELDKRPGSVHLQTKHGTPLKFMGLDIRPVRPNEMNWPAFAARCQRWDYVLSSNPFSTKTWRRGFPYNYKILESGYPRNDIFFNASERLVADIRKRVSIPASAKVALYAPTFRDNDRQTQKPTEFAKAFDPDKVLEALGPDYVLLLRAHYLTTSESTKPNPRIIDVSNYVDSNELCLISDVLITDYSSIMFDFANLDRPIVLYVYDYDEYMEQRGTYFDIREDAPGPIATSQKELLTVLRKQQWRAPENEQRRRAFKAEFCPFDDGNATKRVVDTIFEG